MDVVQGEPKPQPNAHPQPAVGTRPSHTPTGGSDSPAPAPRASPSRLVQSSCLAPRSSDTLRFPVKAGSSRLRGVRNRTGAKPLVVPSERGCPAAAALPAGAAAGAAGCREREPLTEPPEPPRTRSRPAGPSSRRDRQRVRLSRRPRDVTSEARRSSLSVRFPRGSPNNRYHASAPPGGRVLGKRG